MDKKIAAMESFWTRHIGFDFGAEKVTVTPNMLHFIGKDMNYKNAIAIMNLDGNAVVVLFKGPTGDTQMVIVPKCSLKSRKLSWMRALTRGNRKKVLDAMQRTTLGLNFDAFFQHMISIYGMDKTKVKYITPDKCKGYLTQIARVIGYKF